MKSKRSKYTEKQKQMVAAFGMLCAGMLVIIGTNSYVPNAFPVAKQAAVSSGELPEPETESTATGPNEPIVVAVSQPETESQPTEEELRSAIRLNMAYQYPEGADTTDAGNSIAGNAFRELSDKDAQWLAGIYGLSNTTPLDLAHQQGRSVDSVIGSYDITDAAHVETDPKTWTINSWSKINTTFYDGNGSVISGYSNTKEIISMASVYAYYHDIQDEETFLSYCRALWDASHGYSVRMGDVYYCDGCVGESKESAGGTNADGVPIEGTTAPAPIETAPAETIAMETETTEVLAALETLALSEEAAPETIPADWETIEGPQRDIWESMIASASNASPFSVENGSEPATTSAPVKCPGHIDLKVSVTIYGLTGANSLFTKDEKKGQKSEDSAWDGWNNFNRLYAKGLEQTDWFSRYGLTVSDNLYITNPLSPSEIAFYMDKMPLDTSAQRRRVVKQALQSVGCIPYYWGGKPSTSGFTGNQFGTLITPDTNGRALRGLDCSGWINWVYWTALGTSLPAESTSGLTNCGMAIERENLKPGDIIIKTGEDAHVFMFLSWAEDGSMYVIHETGGIINNVTVSRYNVHWPYYRSLLNE